jgi:hypothetical protein
MSPKNPASLSWSSLVMYSGGRGSLEETEAFWSERFQDLSGNCLGAEVHVLQDEPLVVEGLITPSGTVSRHKATKIFIRSIIFVFIRIWITGGDKSTQILARNLLHDVVSSVGLAATPAR